MENITALVSTFARAFHYRNHSEWIFEDSLAEKMLTEEEYAGISKNMAEGISFFAPGFEGTEKDALRFIVDHQLAPSVLARSAFCEQAMDHAIGTGCRQIVLYACGYDTFSLRTSHKDLWVFELDRPEMITDKQRRIAGRNLQPACHVEYLACDLSESSWKEDLRKKGFHEDQRSFGSLLGISYYLSKEEFRNLISNIASVWSEGSCLCFDYPLSEEGTESRRNRELAAAAGETMKANYTQDELETLLAEAGFIICEQMNADEATERLFEEYNRNNAEFRMTAPNGVGYCLAVKSERDER